MPAISFLGAMSAGHDGFNPRPNLEASSNVFVNGKGIHRVGDSWEIHCDSTSCHDGVEASGSSSVFINGRALARIGDSISCGDIIAEGSPNVFSG